MQRFRGKRQKKGWPGGYVVTTKGGHRVFMIEKWRLGRKWHYSTGCRTLKAAMAELERFELDPRGYQPGATGSLAFNSEAVGRLVLDYRAHQLAQGLTQEWVDEVARCLADWQEALAHRDVLGLNLHRDIKPALDGWPTQRPHRIKALKGFYRWLRQEKGLVDRNQDATLDLKVPQAKPEKLKRRKVVPPEDVEATLKHLPEVTRDVLHLLTATGWHLSEVRRFVDSGEVTETVGGDCLAVLLTRHKSGDLHRTPILYPEHLAAAQRLRARGPLPKRMTLARHMRAACQKAGVPWFGLGQMRHSVLTWAVQYGGAGVKQASEFAGHKSEATTRRFYLDVERPRPVPVWRLLEEG